MKSGVVIGIDADARQVACATLDGVEWTVREFNRTTKTGDFYAAYDRELLALMRLAQDLGAVVYLEGTYLASASSKQGERANVRTFATLCEVRGEILYEARRHGVPVLVVGAGEWRSAVLGRVSGRDELKALAQERAERDTARSDLSEHMCDAVCIAQYGAMERQR